MNLVTCRTYDELSIKAAKILQDKITDIILKKGKAIVALPGGRSVAGILQKLSPLAVDWSKVEIFMIDERIVPIESKDSNYKQTSNLFLHKVNAKAHPFFMERGIDYYNKEFQRVGAHFDVIVLGVGEDGHIAALFPHHPALRVKGKKYVTFQDSPKLPKERITASPDSIKDTDVVILLFSSSGKKKAYDSFMDKKVSIAECPAKIALFAKELVVLTEFS